MNGNVKKQKFFVNKMDNVKEEKLIEGKVTGFVNSHDRKMTAATCNCNGKTYRKSLEETESERNFEEFQKLSWKERKIFVKIMTDV